jgi:hypothetical protein
MKYYIALLLCILATLTTVNAQGFKVKHEAIKGFAAPSYREPNPETFADVLCFIWRLVEIVAVILLVVDAVMKFKGKERKFTHFARYIIFVFGASSVIYSGW